MFHSAPDGLPLGFTPVKEAAGGFSTLLKNSWSIAQIASRKRARAGLVPVGTTAKADR